MATCKFKIGDKVKVVAPAHDFKALYRDNVFTIASYNPNGKKCFNEPHYGCNHIFVWQESELELVEDTKKEKIVITHDGKTTTATKYCGDGSKVTATARCAPEDEFNFEVGAKLALERLDEKVNGEFEWVVVKRNAKVGDYIRLKNDGGYSWNEVGDILRVDEVNCGTCVKVLGKNHIRETDDKNFAWTYIDPEYEVVEKRRKVETPKYYNGKVVCIDKKYGTSRPLPDFTIGKIYDVVDGEITDDVGWKSYSNETLEILCVSTGNTFIPLVE